MTTKKHALCTSLAMLVYGGACSPGPEELEPSSDSITARAPQLAPGEPEVDCAQHVDPPVLVAEWRDAAGGEPVHLIDGTTKLAITNRATSDADVEVRLTLEANGQTRRWSTRSSVRADGRAELRVPLSVFKVDLRGSAYSAQLRGDLVVMSSDGRILHKASAPPVYLHHDRNSSTVLIYSEELLLSRFRGGDLEGRLKHQPEEGAGAAGEVGIARAARPEDLYGDPDDVRRGKGTTR